MEEKGTKLSMPREIKIQTMEDALKEDRFDIFMGLAKILLDAPISQGGIETEVIEVIWNKYE